MTAASKRTMEHRQWAVPGVLMAGLLGMALLLVGCNESEPQASGAPSTKGAATTEMDDVVVLQGEDAKAAVTAGEAQAYPLDVCIVAGGKLGSMGEPVSLVYGEQEVKFCCAGCDTLFLRDPAKYLAKLTDSETP